jgi:prevent-host-death family protein
MLQQVVDANEARRKLRGLLDAAHQGRVTVIARFGKPVAAVISYEDYVAARDAIEEGRDIREAEAELEAYRRDPSSFRTLDDIEAEMREQGLLDE